MVVDTREQLPYEFPGDVRTVRRALPSGDYSIEGAEDRVAVERKRLDELFMCVGRERERFRREFERLASYDFAALVLEGDLREVVAGSARSAVSPAAVVGTMVKWGMRYGVHVVYAGDRLHGMAMTLKILESYADVAALPASLRPAMPDAGMAEADSRPLPA